MQPWETEDEIIEGEQQGGAAAWEVGDEMAGEMAAEAPPPPAAEPEPSMLDKVTGAGEAALSLVSGAVAEPAAGLAGLYSAATEGAEAGAGTVDSVREMLTYAPESTTGKSYIENVGGVLEPVIDAFETAEETLGEATLDATGSPLLATVAHTAPTAALEMLGLGILKKSSKASENAAAAQRRVKADPDLTPEQLAVETLVPEEKSWKDVTELVKRGDRKAVAEQVRPDKMTLRAAEELGVDLNPSHYSTNEAFKRVEQAVTKSRDSELAAREARAIQELGKRADEMIEEFGGTRDKSLLEQDVRVRFDDTIKSLADKAKVEYRAVKESIPPATKVTARGSKAYLEQRLADMGGDVSGLSVAEKELYNVLQGDRPPTYARFDQMRKDIGAGYARQGPFKDDASGNLDQVYKVLSQDQQGVADALGVGKRYQTGRKLVHTRKKIEEQAQKIFGRELQQSIVPKLTSAATGLTKGDVQKFRNLMEALPPDMRERAAVTALNDLFTAGSRASDRGIGAGFANAWGALNRNKGAKAEIFKHLPPDAQRRFDAIGRVSQGIFRAKALENTSKTAVAILQALENGGLVARVMDQASDKAIGAGAMIPGGRGLAATGAVAKRGFKEALDRKKAADSMLTSSDFNRAIDVAMEGRVREAEIMLRRSRVWRRFRDTLGEGTKAQLAAQGPIAWLTSMKEEREPEAVGQ